MSKAMKNKSFIKVTLAAYAVSSLLFFTSLDNKFLDLFLRFLPSLTENEKVFVLTLDDDSMSLAGGFPFRREVMADIVVLLKELGVQTIAFDLSYLDESATRFNEEYASEVFDDFLYDGFSYLDGATAQIVDRIGPATTSRDRDLYKRDLRNLQENVRLDLKDSIPHLAWDVDEYFAKALAFSGSSWLTLTMIMPQDRMSDSELATNEEVDRFLAENIAPENIIGMRDTKTPEMIGVIPAIYKLMSRSRGAGFVNAAPDTDGLRRRVNLLLKYRGDYYGQLVLMALKEKLGYTSIEVSNRTVTLKKDNDVMLRIPRAQDGSVLLKWPKKSFYDYNMMSLIELIQHTLIESVFVHNIIEMDDWGLLYYMESDYTPLEYYLIADDIRRDAFANNGAGGDDWLSARQDFLQSCEAFLYGPYESEILADYGSDLSFAGFVRDLFDSSREQYERMMDIRGRAAVLRDSFCIIGSDATSMTDNGLITFQENYPNVGSYAVLANMLLSGEFLDDASWIIPAIIALIFSLLIGFFVSRFETHLSIITGISGIVLIFASFVTFFLISKIYIGLAVPLVATTLTFVSIMVTKFLTASREKAFLHNAFSRYLAPEVITEIINDPDKLNLGGEKRERTAIFTDIQCFSTISEPLDPTQLVKLLNRYLTAMSNIVMENRGTIDKYEGDAIIAFFGAPVFHADHAVLALRSAIAMKAAEKELNKAVMEEKLSPSPIFTRIGINTGDMVVGNMGAENKMDYTIMGNAVNLAARLEGVNKQYRTGILISEYTREKIGDEFLLRRLDRVRVVGIHTPLRLYHVLGLQETATEAERSAADQWEKALDLFESKQFAQALESLNSLRQSNPEDRTVELYIERCEAYIKEPPPPEWDAVKNMTEK
jgi:adenylate cyclase